MHFACGYVSCDTKFSVSSSSAAPMTPLIVLVTNAARSILVVLINEAIAMIAATRRRTL